MRKQTKYVIGALALGIILGLIPYIIVYACYGPSAMWELRSTGKIRDSVQGIVHDNSPGATKSVPNMPASLNQSILNTNHSAFVDCFQSLWRIVSIMLRQERFWHSPAKSVNVAVTHTLRSHLTAEPLSQLLRCNV